MRNPHRAGSAPVGSLAQWRSVAKGDIIFVPAGTIHAIGAGIVLAEHGSAESYVKAGQLVRVLPEWEIQPVPLSAVFPERRLMPSRTRAFIDALVDKFGGSKRA